MAESELDAPRATLVVRPSSRIGHRERDEHKWDVMADELVELIAEHLVPGTLESPWLSRPLSEVSSYYSESSVGAAHWLQLSKALARRAQRCGWEVRLRKAKRSRDETAACCRVLECHHNAGYDCGHGRRSNARDDHSLSTLLHSRSCAMNCIRAARGSQAPGLKELWRSTASTQPCNSYEPTHTPCGLLRCRERGMRFRVTHASALTHTDDCCSHRCIQTASTLRWRRRQWWS